MEIGAFLMLAFIIGILCMYTGKSGQDILWAKEFLRARRREGWHIDDARAELDRQWAERIRQRREQQK